MALADPTVFAAVFVALYAAHEVGDHWVQTHRQACGKGAPTWRGRWLCAGHVASLTATKAAAVAVVAVATGLSLSPVAAAVALLLDAVSHYVIDRRAPLQALATRLGKADFAALGDPSAAPVGTGAYALDQSWHIGWLLIAALVMSIGGAA